MTFTMKPAKRQVLQPPKAKLWLFGHVDATLLQRADAWHGAQAGLLKGRMIEVAGASLAKRSFETMDIQSRLQEVNTKIAKAEKEAGRNASSVQLVAVSKTFDADDIRPVIEAGQRVFGENRVQESQGKWPLLKAETSDIELHLIGPLQSNKAADAVALFDVIETVDREKIARALATEMKAQNRLLPVYIQVNTGLEPQKAGIAPDDTVSFAGFCRDELGLNVVGLMCIPPADENPGPHFALLAKLAEEAGLSRLSMGMSGDYDVAIAFGATSVRVGSAIFGSR